MSRVLLSILHHAVLEETMTSYIVNKNILFTDYNVSPGGGGGGGGALELYFDRGVPHGTLKRGSEERA